MLHSDLRYDFVKTWFTKLTDVSFSELQKVFNALVKQGKEALKHSGIKPQEIAISYAADMRYVGQEHPVTVDLNSEIFKDRDRQAIKLQFDAVHQRRYGTCAPKEAAEIVSLRVTVSGIMKKPPLEKISKGSSKPPKLALSGHRQVYFSELGKSVKTPTFDRTHLKAGNKIQGPALIEEYASITVVQPGDQLRVDDFGNLIINIQGSYQ
jgi:N-methylhydantoinase A